MDAEPFIILILTIAAIIAPILIIGVVGLYFQRKLLKSSPDSMYVKKMSWYEFMASILPAFLLLRKNKRGR